MQILTRLVFVIGVTLSVTPIFSSALAQQGTGEARLLLEIQTLRSEIAELRGMVEQQQYEMRQLRRATQSPTAVRPSQSGGSEPLTQTTLNPAAPVNQVPAAGQVNQQTAANQQATVATSPNGQSTWSRPGDLNEEGFYRQYEVTDAGRKPIESAAGNQTGIEQRVITAPPLPNNKQDDRYAPVEDRSIGGSTNGGLTQQNNGRYAPDNSDAGWATAQPQVNDRGTMPIGGAGANATVTSPVVQIPARPTSNTQAAASNSAYQPAVTNRDPLGNQAPASNSASLPTPDAAILSEDEYYDQGFNLVKQSNFKDAVNVFQQLIAKHPNGALVGDAHYWIGEASFLGRDLDTSKKYFRTFINDYPQSGRVPGAMLRTAYIEQEQGNQIEARILLNEIIQYHPNSDAVHAAKNRLADIEQAAN